MKKIIQWTSIFVTSVLLLILVSSGKGKPKHNIEYILSEKSPKPIGPYSQATVSGNTVYLSGQIAISPTGELDTSSITRETIQIMENLKAVLQAASVDFDRVVKTTIYLSDMQYFAEVNKVYAGYFSGNRFPARETVSVKSLPRNARVEIGMVAVLR